jgi:hypothetical protein
MGFVAFTLPGVEILLPMKKAKRPVADAGAATSKPVTA